MNFIGKHIQLIGIILLTAFVGTAAGLYFDVPARLHHPRIRSVVSPEYTCPMHPEVVSANPGGCPKCGMALVSRSQVKPGHGECGDHEKNHPGCCTDKSSTQPATQLRLPPGHPPIPGWPTDTTPSSEPASSKTPPQYPH